jgi:hypothetical protein
MKKVSIRLMGRLILSMALLAICATAHEHTALNGTWTLAPDKSDFGGQPAIKSGTVTIDERQGNITVSRNFEYEGAAGTVFYRDMTDSRNNASIHAGDLKSKTKWDHDVLKVTTTQGGAITVESYSLGADGTMLVNVARPEHAAITLVFQRQ